MFKNFNRDKAPTVVVTERRSVFTFSNLFKVIFAIALITMIASAINKESGNNYVKYETSFEIYNKYFNEMKINKKSPKELSEAVYSKTMYLIDFVGSVTGEEVEKLKRDIDFIIINSKQGDEVAVKLYSPGGAVTSYGLASSELKRLKDAGLTVTILVDEVAASGGYMMAVVSDKIVAAPFAYVGSIGVVAQLPIYEDLLKNFGVEYKVYTAGDNKRNVVSQIKPSTEDEEKLKIQISKIHSQFKSHVKKYRNSIDIEKVANGDVFSGEEALELKLVDEISTSSNYLLDKHNKNTRIVYVFTEETEAKKIGGINAFADRFINTLSDKIVNEVKSQFYNKYENIKLQ